ncbi:ubiquitin-protein ligase E3A isoform X1 [Schistocerca piceifrons]|uniref:ubiquitin-protein ligase E3A isoform X1 n=2 Tax=Schistocerca piceifrons TaxID=274613 RepID=UPI001F5E8581|nr:ubiquitin-protein ligase E3A isoform X1 [Schistocerca piceifrons]
MSSQNKEHEREDGEASSSSAASSSELTSTSHSTDTMKRAAAKKLIERYFYQLTDGCGNTNCDNEFCASSGKVKSLTPNQAAVQAIQLFSQEARLCDAQPTKVARTQQTMTTKNNEKDSVKGDDVTKNDSCMGAITPTKVFTILNKLETNDSAHCTAQKTVPYLTEEKLMEVIRKCKEADSYSLLIRTLGEVYSSIPSLSASFRKEHPDSPIDAVLEKAPKNLKNLKKEDVRIMEGDMDKDEDSTEMSCDVEGAECQSSESKTKSVKDEVWIDFASLRRTYEALFALPVSAFESALVNALVSLAGDVELDLMFGVHSDEILHALVVVFEIPELGKSEFLEVALPQLCKAASHLSVTGQAWLARVWSRHCKTRLKSLLEALQELITRKVLSGHFNREYVVQDDEYITSATKLMKVLYYANILAGELDPPELRQEVPNSSGDEVEEGHFFAEAAGDTKNGNPQHFEDPLSVELGVNVLDSREPHIPFTEFYHVLLNDVVEMDKDFAYYKSDSTDSLPHMTKKFSFMKHSFILTPATKSLGLYYDNRIRMYSERRMSFFHTVVGQPTNPFLKLRVRRDHIIEDALVELEVVAMESPKDFKKQLVVEFEGEQGIDEGGVSKEFFQLIVEEIFNADYGMFTFQQETQTVWFNPTSFESDAQFTLIGIVLGLAIYNNIILDVHFPMVVYRKLMGKRGTFYDLQDWNKALYKGLTELLEYEGEDMEETFLQTFRICYQDVFGATLYHELKESGDEIYVSQDNKKEFVDLYADFLLNTSVEKQFKAFRKGFHMVTDESPLQLLFRPEEVEELVCGSKNFNFNELEEATEYDGGYTSDTPIIRDFWDIVHNMPLDYKRKLLQFATGSDRVPVGGLSKLKLIIARNGSDSDRLPTAHTCFNVLLLPEYETKEKLNDRLMKAIKYSKGFGML